MKTNAIRMNWWMAIVGALALWGVAGCSSTRYTDINSAVRASANVPKRLEKINGVYRLGARDVIQVKVINETGLTGPQTIRGDGNITMDLIGDIYVEGYTPMQAAGMLKDAYGAYLRNPNVTVTVVGFNSKKFYVFGETNNMTQRVFDFDGDTSVLTAVGRAGGLTTRAAWDRVRVVRATTTTRQIFKINLSDIIKQGRGESNIQLKENDIVYVPPTYIARVGYFIDNLLFPFRSLVGARTTYDILRGNNNNNNNGGL